MEFEPETLIAHIDANRLVMEMSLCELGGIMKNKAVEVGKVEFVNVDLANTDAVKIIDAGGSGRGPIIHVEFPIIPSEPV